MKPPSRNDIWKMFNQISPTYDRINRILSLGFDQKWRRKVCQYLDKKKELQILDLATGTADQLIALFESSISIKKAVGIDLAKDMLTIGRKKIQERGFDKKTDLIEADAQKLPFPEMSFDAATFSFGIRNISDPALALQEIYRVLKPNGLSLILEFALPSKPWRWVHLLYLRHILPKLGGFFSKNKGAYQYLNQTIETFPQGKSFCTMLENVGFKEISMHKMGLGAVALYIGKKK